VPCAARRKKHKAEEQWQTASAGPERRRHGALRIRLWVPPPAGTGSCGHVANRARSRLLAGVSGRPPHMLPVHATCVCAYVRMCVCAYVRMCVRAYVRTRSAGGAAAAADRAARGAAEGAHWGGRAGRCGRWCIACRRRWNLHCLMHRKRWQRGTTDDVGIKVALVLRPQALALP